MTPEHIQNLIVAIEALIQSHGVTNAAAEARILQEMERAKLTETQNEAVMHLLMALKGEKEQGEADDEEGKKKHADHMKKMHKEMCDMFEGVKAQLQTDSNNLTTALQAMTTSLASLAEEAKKKEQYAYDIEITPELAKKLKGADGITPVKGKDYFTAADKQELIAAVLPLLEKEEEAKDTGELDQVNADLKAIQAKITAEAIADALKGRISFEDLADAPKIEQAVQEVRRKLAELAQKGAATGRLDELSNVDTQGVQNGQVIAWNATKRIWQPVAQSGGGGLHESLPDLQGGTSGQHLHLTQSEHDILTNGTLDIADSLHLHSKTVLIVRNETGVTIPAGRMVYMSGFNNVPLVGLANNTQPNTHHYIGITTAAINDQTNGIIVTGGLASPIDTNAIGVVGTELYLTINGILSATRPTSGTVVVVGNVAVQQNNGSILLIPNSTGAQYVAAVQNDNVDVRMGDIAGATKVKFENYNDQEVASIDSLGNANFNGDVNLPAGKSFKVNGVPVGGGVTTSALTVTTDTTVTSANKQYIANCASNQITFALPTAASSNGQEYSFKKIDSTPNNMVITPNGADLIEGDGNLTTDMQYVNIVLVSNGSYWAII